MGDDGAVRIELVLEKPGLGWYPKPTVVIDGRGQPAQWGRGTWQVRPGTSIGVYLFNRLWRFGTADLTLAEPLPASLSYRAPLLPVGKGRLRLV
ncbi:hypothetical protein AX769_07795 [Frondihabitans sp. PAMC 28766]|uniref:hypothetical protein n=1 Tax=Frondihabitans sp. PAMC 28766 TaxID=1795630 RepID=UPI00078D8338|nr:hypothetical protein [Frondihabitans sp. PAMC 28766]AMM20085.1 hypothetical protein AX769_07795 [Frondihabitans sp. PAMC 28766]